MFKVVLLIGVISGCSKDEDPAPVNTIGNNEEIVVGPSTPGSGKFIITSNNVEENANGYIFEGTLSGENNKEETFEIGHGEFEVEVGPGDEIESITGVGIPEFPRIGVFADMLASFDWKAVKSHFEYETGLYFKGKYNDEIPLDDNTKYLHIKVFDESNDTRFELKNKANGLIYKFVDFYVDINDPSVFFKAPLILPSSGGNKGSEETKTILQKITDKIKSKNGTISDRDNLDKNGLVYAMSNQGLIKSAPYNFENDIIFEELFGFSGFEELESHSYTKAAAIPLPPLPIFRLFGESYIHYPVNEFFLPPADIIDGGGEALVNWFSDPLGHFDPSYMVNFNGKIDMGGTGIAFILGILPQSNNLIGNVFNEEINLDLGAATLQYQLEKDNSFLRFGGEFNRPLLSDILHDDIKKYIISQPNPEGYLYLSIGNELEDWSLYMETNTTFSLPKIGEVEFSDSYFVIDKDKIYAEGNFDLPSYGILDIQRKFKGTIDDDGFEFESEYDGDINLPNGVTLASKDVKIKITNEKGVYLEGSVVLPFGTTEAEVMAEFNKEKISFSGTITSGLDIDLGYEFPSRNLTISASSDPADGFHIAGEIDVPHLSYRAVEGIINANEVILTSTVNTTIDIAGISLPISNGNLEISNTNGVLLDGMFTLPAGLAKARMNGILSPDDIALSGSITTGLTVSGYSFPFSNTQITASSNTGIKLSGTMNLYLFSASVSGEVMPGGQFKLTGSRQLTANVGIGTFSSNVGITVRNTGITMGGTGTIKGPLGGTLYSGTYTIQPNWAARTFRVCFGGACFNL